MKKCALQIVTICLALFMLCICGGIDIYHCCCDDCTEHKYAILKCNAEENHCEKHCDGHCEHHSDAECEIEHIDAPYMSQFVKAEIDFESPLVAILPISMHNAQCTMHNPECKVLSEAIPLAQNLTGRAIIVRKATYLL